MNFSLFSTLIGHKKDEARRLKEKKNQLKNIPKSSAPTFTKEMMLNGINPSDSAGPAVLNLLVDDVRKHVASKSLKPETKEITDKIASGIVSLKRNRLGERKEDPSSMNLVDLTENSSESMDEFCTRTCEASRKFFLQAPIQLKEYNKARRVLGKKELSADDVMNGRFFEDEIEDGQAPHES